MAQTADDFRRTCASFATGVAVATVADGDGNPYGLTVNSFTSVSLKPPLILFCIDKTAGVYEVFMDATHYGINILQAGQQRLSDRFAFYAGDRFAGVDWQPGHAGVPRLQGAIAWLAASIEARWDAGDHTVLLGRVECAEAPGGDPLLYFRSRYARMAE
jgi:flavin reductase (DIM6/NTAB) family NADH-FMN oxidoreductase RutF